MSSRNQTKFTQKLKGKRILIFGGSSGIGYAVAEAVLEYGAEVIISSSNSTKIDNAVATLRAAYPDSADLISSIVCDMSKLDELEANLRRTFDLATTSGSKLLNHVVSTAGDIRPPSSFKDVTSSNLFSGCSVRFGGMVFIGKVAPEYLVTGEDEDASLTFTTGTVTWKPIPGRSVAVGFAGGIEAMVGSLAAELAPHVRVNCVSPGAIKTPLLDDIIATGGGEKVADGMKNTVLLKKLGRPEDIAEAYCYFLKDTYVTGEVLLSDGGRRLV